MIKMGNSHQLFVTAADIQDGSITTAKLADDAVTPDKLAAREYALWVPSTAFHRIMLPANLAYIHANYTRPNALVTGTTVVAVIPIPVGATLTEVTIYCYMSNAGSAAGVSSSIINAIDVDSNQTVNIVSLFNQNLTGIIGLRTATWSGIEVLHPTDAQAVHIAATLTATAATANARLKGAQIVFEL